MILISIPFYVRFEDVIGLFRNIACFCRILYKIVIKYVWIKQKEFAGHIKRIVFNLQIALRNQLSEEFY